MSLPIIEIAVALPTHNPHPERLRRTLLGLRAQTFPAQECIIVDNASEAFPDAAFFHTCAPTNTQIVRESQLGLTAARRRGFAETRASIIVLVDDDNVLAPDYLECVARIFSENQKLGAAGGRSVPDFETTPAPWQSEFFALLALRDLGAEPKIATNLRSDSGARNEYPAFAPIGAGMAVRRAALAPWLSASTTLSDRCGRDLSSAGDNDLVLSILSAGWHVGYFPQLTLTHLIPGSRLEPAYLSRLNRGIQKSWMEVLRRYSANPWSELSSWSARIRQLKSWFGYRAWQSPAAYIRWQGACGHFEGRVRQNQPRSG